jgi:hypothetical protein
VIAQVGDDTNLAKVVFDIQICISRVRTYREIDEISYVSNKKQKRSKHTAEERTA